MAVKDMSSEFRKPPLEQGALSESDASLADAEKYRQVALAEQNKLSKYLAKADQRVAAHKLEFQSLEATRHFHRPGSQEARRLLALIDKTLSAWGAAADDRLQIIDRLCVARENARHAETRITRLGFQIKKGSAGKSRANKLPTEQC